MTIDLAPNHKIGLPISSPIMPAAGFFGYHGKHYHPLIDAERFGAWVTNPITLRPHRATKPQFAEVLGGIIIQNQRHNFGVKKIIRQNKRFWYAAKTPLIAHLPADNPADLARTVAALDGLQCFSAFELAIPANAELGEIAAWMSAIFRNSELPTLAKVPAPQFPSLAEGVLELGADALTISMAIPAATYRAKSYFEGNYFGIAVAAQALPIIKNARATFPNVPLIVSGAHSTDDARAYLQAGATAVQLDSLIFIDSMQVQSILAAFWEGN